MSNKTKKLLETVDQLLEKEDYHGSLEILLALKKQKNSPLALQYVLQGFVDLYSAMAKKELAQKPKGILAESYRAKAESYQEEIGRNFFNLLLVYMGSDKKQENISALILSNKTCLGKICEGKIEEQICPAIDKRTNLFKSLKAFQDDVLIHLNEIPLSKEQAADSLYKRHRLVA